MSNGEKYTREGATGRTRRQTRRRVNVWLIVGVVVLIVLLLFWLTWADLLGDTDVSAFVTPK